MSVFTKDELDKTQQEAQKILIQLESVEEQGWVKKGDLIKSYVDKNRILRDAGVLEINGFFSSYIREKLKERNISVGQNDRFTNLFTSDEKDPRGQTKDLDEESKNISSGHSKTIDEKYREQVLTPTPKNDKITKHFDNQISNAREAIALSEALKDKYNESEELAKVMVEELKDIDKLVIQDLEIASVLSLARKQIDDRNKWGNYEKLVAQFLIAVGETKAELAKKLNYCSKYASIGIERNEELTSYWHFLGQCPACKEDVHEYFDLQIQKYLKGTELDIDTPLKGY